MLQMRIQAYDDGSLRCCRFAVKSAHAFCLYDRHFIFRCLALFHFTNKQCQKAVGADYPQAFSAFAVADNTLLTACRLFTAYVIFFLYLILTARLHARLPQAAQAAATVCLQ